MADNTPAPCNIWAPVIVTPADIVATPLADRDIPLPKVNDVLENELNALPMYGAAYPIPAPIPAPIAPPNTVCS